jgi:hypothetical protein
MSETSATRGIKTYISGKITGDPGYQEKFARVEGELARRGYTVMNPATLPGGFAYEDYMHVCLAMIDVCDVVVLLDDWQESRGARREYEHAVRANKRAVLAKEVVSV